MSQQEMRPKLGAADINIEGIDVVYNGFFKILRYRFQHRLFSGSWSDTLNRELFERGDAVAMLPYDPITDNVVLVEQIRVGAIAANAVPWQFEIVAGMIDSGKSADEVAIREAKEEAGLDVSALYPITQYLSSSGGSSERIHLFLGIVDSTTAQGIHGLPSEGEDILVHVVSRETAMEWVECGKIENAASIIALQWLALKHPLGLKTWQGVR